MGGTGGLRFQNSKHPEAQGGRNPPLSRAGEELGNGMLRETISGQTLPHPIVAMLRKQLSDTKNRHSQSTCHEPPALPGICYTLSPLTILVPGQSYYFYPQFSGNLPMVTYQKGQNLISGPGLMDSKAQNLFLHATRIKGTLLKTFRSPFFHLPVFACFKSTFICPAHVVEVCVLSNDPASGIIATSPHRLPGDEEGSIL